MKKAATTEIMMDNGHLMQVWFLKLQKTGSGFLFLWNELQCYY